MLIYLVYFLLSVVVTMFLLIIMLSIRCSIGLQRYEKTFKYQQISTPQYSQPPQTSPYDSGERGGRQPMWNKYPWQNYPEFA